VSDFTQIQITTTSTPFTAPTKIYSLLIKPVSAMCNLDCEYCFYLDRDTDPYKDTSTRRMSRETLRKMVESFLFYAFPHSVFAFQGGEPTLAGLRFFEQLVQYQQRYGRAGQTVSNALQTNAILLDDAWCQFLRSYQWLVGASLDGTEEMHDTYRRNRGREGTWKKVMASVERMAKHGVEYNVLCVLSQANIHQPRELYAFFRSIGVEYLQFIPLAEFTPTGDRQPSAISAEEYGRFLVELFDVWWPERQKVRIRFFDNLVEALAGYTPGNCTMHERCNSYVVVEYNGDVYPCDFFVEPHWKLGNVHKDTWSQIARAELRARFAYGKTVPHDRCLECEYRRLCRFGCPSFRAKQHGNAADLDYFCDTYKAIYSHCLPALRAEVAQITGRPAAL
jgi:uncharacterized protein